MQILTGRYKGKVFKVPRGIRPTPHIIRKAIFDVLGDIRDVYFLELFAGSGAIGLEALSKGAKEVVFVENDKNAVKIIRENLRLLGVSKQKVMEADVLRAIKYLSKQTEKFEVIFADPPYYKELAKKTLKNLFLYDILAPKGFIIIQHYIKDSLPDRLGDLILLRQKRYGQNLVSFYQKQR